MSARKYGEAGKTGSSGTTHTHLEFRAQGKETCGVPQLQAGGSLCERMCSATGKGLPRWKQDPNLTPPSQPLLLHQSIYHTTQYFPPGCLCIVWWSEMSCTILHRGPSWTGLFKEHFWRSTVKTIHQETKPGSQLAEKLSHPSPSVQRLLHCMAAIHYILIMYVYMYMRA